VLLRRGRNCDAWGRGEWAQVEQGGDSGRSTVWVRVGAVGMTKNKREQRGGYGCPVVTNTHTHKVSDGSNSTMRHKEGNSVEGPNTPNFTSGCWCPTFGSWFLRITVMTSLFHREPITNYQSPSLLQNTFPILARFVSQGRGSYSLFKHCRRAGPYRGNCIYKHGKGTSEKVVF